MSRPATAEPQADETLRNLDVVGWRYERLRQAGYPPEDAVRLAESAAIDLHFACDLLEGGCPAELAVAILT